MMNGLVGWKKQGLRFSMVGLEVVGMHPRGFVRDTVRDLAQS